ncbi:hypothetical protein BDB00DRAFT_799065 [Zychaea mexicana]|uniref:uncharacterized protein n=1 Tax=Zychaea mexicana TaxID=64656 RepID=UPI0022FDD7F3|nr:uncharacterized protein BDB00DRAFT_799065 [Zychaea mexicana]KAI9498674.1 hypothetical protein BDB00DRAFT_799065 [Zychaea mexicana]
MGLLRGKVTMILWLFRDPHPLVILGEASVLLFLGLVSFDNRSYDTLFRFPFDLGLGFPCHGLGLTSVFLALDWLSCFTYWISFDFDLHCFPHTSSISLLSRTHLWRCPHTGLFLSARALD